MGTKRFIGATLISSMCLFGAVGCSEDNEGGPIINRGGAPDSPLQPGGGAGSGGTDPSGPGAGGGNNGSGSNILPETPVCQGDCCPSISGRVFDPGGNVPLYNVVVYVPDGELEPLQEGVACGRCAASVRAFSSALTNTEGRFTLPNVPQGDNIPVVMQVGKWRRQVHMNVQGCGEHNLSEELSRLPRNKSEGNIPQFAVSTGGADSLECVMRKMGIDDSEFTRPDQDGRVHVYQGEGWGGGWGGGGGSGNFWEDLFTALIPAGEGASLPGGTALSTELWASEENLSRYDVVMLSCEGSENRSTKDAHMGNMAAYMNKGGRVFASHFHYVWFKHGPGSLPQTADWTNGSSSRGGTFAINENHPRGQAFADWLVNVGATPTRGVIDLSDVRHNVNGVDSLMSTAWVQEDDPHSVKYYSFNTPAGDLPENQCGRAVYTDIHVQDGVSSFGGEFPSHCGNDRTLSAQEKALMFLLFDLSSCVQPPTEPPAPPIAGPS